ncbi:MAG: SCO6745 family protein, partial [Sciscionella sp.]
MNIEETARRMWVLFEGYHDVTYFSPESRAAADALGALGGWMGYFAMRAAPLGAASPELVTSAFYSFAPAKVARALPEAWQIARPERWLGARLDGVDRCLRRILGERRLAGEAVAEAAELLSEAAAKAALAGRV